MPRIFAVISLLILAVIFRKLVLSLLLVAAIMGVVGAAVLLIMSLISIAISGRWTWWFGNWWFK